MCYSYFHFVEILLDHSEPFTKNAAGFMLSYIRISVKELGWLARLDLDIFIATDGVCSQKKKTIQVPHPKGQIRRFN